MKVTLRITRVENNPTMREFIGGPPGYYTADVHGNPAEGGGYWRLLLPGLLASNQNRATLIEKAMLHLTRFGFAAEDIKVEDRKAKVPA